MQQELQEQQEQQRAVKWKTRSAECGVWKMRSVENAECRKCGVSKKTI